jgi:hypothetical protein
MERVQDADAVVIGTGVGGEGRGPRRPAPALIYACPTFHRGVEDTLGDLVS